MAIDVKVPSVGESVAEGILTTWSVPDGGYVEKGQTLFELETDKASTDVPAPESGVLHHSVPEGEEVTIGAVVGTIDPEGKASDDSGKSKEQKAEPAEAPAESSADRDGEEKKDQDESDDDDGKEEASSSGKQAAATSVARKIAEENKIDLSSVRGTGPSGRITREDVERVVASLEDDSVGKTGAQFTSVDNIERLPAPPPSSFSPGDAQAEAAKPSAQQQTPKVKAEPASPPPSTSASSSPEAGEDQTREKMSMLRRRIAQRLVEAQHNAAMLTTFNDVDMSAVMELRKQFKEPFKEKHGVGLGFMSFFVKASIEALKAYPRVNAFIDGNEVVKNHRHHVGVAVSTPKGLVVPVVRNAGDLTFAQIESAIMDVALRARDGDLDIAEMQGGTFTITNGGVFGSMLSTPILNPPQSAILGMHRIDDRPVALDGQVVIRPMMYLALSYDHRIVDGREAVGFLVRIKECIENPSRLLLEV